MEQIIDFIGIENVDNAMVIIILMGMAFMYLFCCELHFQENKPMSDTTQNVVVTKQGVGFCGLLFIVLLLLKVGVVETTVAGWSWWWIFAPLWGPVAIIVGILLLIGAIGVLCFLFYLIGKFIILLSEWIVDFIIRWNKKRTLKKARRR